VQKASRNDELIHLLDTLQRELVRAVHDVNNPLAIISGNAQMLAELMRGQNVDAEVEKSVADIEEASTVLAERLERLSALRESLSSVINGYTAAE
jgi:signal transduction histidine kinase